jgi:hypothetical protein
MKATQRVFATAAHFCLGSAKCAVKTVNFATMYQRNGQSTLWVLDSTSINDDNYDKLQKNASKAW